MDKSAANALKRARMRKGITQEALEELSGWSVDSIQAWERSTRMPSLEALSQLALYLDAPWLPDTYLRERVPALSCIIPDYRVGRPLPEAAAEFISCVLDLVDSRFDRKLLRMVADGQIDEVEAPVYDDIMEAAAKINIAYFELRFSTGAVRKG